MRNAIVLLAGFLSLTVLPAPAATPEKESTYEVEIVVFENLLPELLGEEILARDSESRVKNLEDAVTPEPAQSPPYLKPAITDLLEKDGHYRVLAYQYWQQTLDARTIAKPVRIVATNPAELDGTVRLFLSRYLHLDVNLLFRDRDNTVYRLKEQRKLRSQETHYYDHPKFGVLVRIMPLEIEKPKAKL